MTQRERILAIAVGSLLGLGILYWGLTRVQKGFDEKQKRIDTVRKAIEDKDDTIDLGMMASQKLARLVPKSLPTNIEDAKADYKDWLNEIAAECELESPATSFMPGSETDGKGVYRTLKYTLTGKCNISKLTDLLYEYYQQDYIHRITNLVITPETVVGDPYRLNVSLTSEVMILNDASPDQEPPTTMSNRLAMGLEEYRKVIVNRNLLALANHPPEVKPEEKTEAKQGELLEFTCKAEDPDGGQEMVYAIEGETPDGMKIDPKTGKITWKPKDLGSVEVLIAASDTGLPSRTSKQKLSIKVVEAPPKKKEAPKLDVASQAEITALLADSKRPQVWVKSKLEAKVYYLKVGDELKLGSVVGTVLGIGATYAEFETEGKRWTAGQGETLADAFKRGNDDE